MRSFPINAIHRMARMDRHARRSSPQSIDAKRSSLREKRASRHLNKLHLMRRRTLAISPPASPLSGRNARVRSATRRAAPAKTIAVGAAWCLGLCAMRVPRVGQAALRRGREWTRVNGETKHALVVIKSERVAWVRSVVNAVVSTRADARDTADQKCVER